MIAQQTTEPRVPIRAALNDAAKATELLERAGCKVLTAFDNGRRIALVVNEPPSFVTGHVKARHPNGRGGKTVVFAAPFHGCQLEWAVDEPVSVKGAAHG